MKKILLLLLMSATVLCGCEKVPEETGTLDYAKMDEEFGQNKNENTELSDDSELFEEDLDEIEEIVEEYAEMLVEKDAEGCADTFPESFIKAIADEKGCSEDVARGIAAGKIEETFNKKEYKFRAISSLWNDESHSIKIERIKNFPQRSALKSIYLGFGVGIEDAIDIDFLVTVTEESQKSDIRLVKLENGDWEIDMGYFEI